MPRKRLIITMLFFTLVLMANVIFPQNALLAPKDDGSDIQDEAFKSRGVFLNIKNPPQPFAAAKGDGKTDDTQTIQSVLDYAYRIGGALVYVPEGHYIISKPLKVKDNVWLCGSGYNTLIENITQSGINRMCIMTGNIGDITGSMNSFSIYHENKCNLREIKSGDNEIRLVDQADASLFNIGDLVYIQSSETWPSSPSDYYAPVLENVNEVVEKEGTLLRLKYAIPDTYSGNNGNPKVAKFSGKLRGLDGSPLWMAKRAKISNLRLKHEMGLASGWYAIFSDGFECTYENICFDGVSCPFGSDGMGYSTIKDCYGYFDARCIDLADFIVGVTIENCKFTRLKAPNRSLGAEMGVGIYNGTDNTIKNCTFQLNDIGTVSSIRGHRFKLINNKISNSKLGIGSVTGKDCEIIGNTIINSAQHGIVIASDRTICKGNRIYNTGQTGSYYAILINPGIKDCIITDNICGETGGRTFKDSILQAKAYEKSNIISGNQTYQSQPNMNDSLFASTNSSTETALKSYNIFGGNLRRETTYKIRASGSISGKNNAKLLKLKLGNNIIGQASFAKSDTGRWYLEAIVSHPDFGTNPRCYCSIDFGATNQYRNLQMFTNGLLENTTLAITGTLTDSNDIITCDLFIIDVVEDGQ